MSNRVTLWISLLIILLAVGISSYVSPSLPESMVSHWDINGNPDGSMSKFWGLYLMPLIGLITFLLIFFVPYLDPEKKNIEDFRESYNLFAVVLMLFFFYLHVLTLAFNLGYKLNMTQFLAPGFAVLFYTIGVLLKKAKRNWFIGIRTPWTLSSDVVWGKTHALGSKVFRYGAIIMLLGIFLPQYAFLIVLLPTIGGAMYLLIYSYLEFKKLKG